MMIDTIEGVFAGVGKEGSDIGTPDFFAIHGHRGECVWVEV